MGSIVKGIGKVFGAVFKVVLKPLKILQKALRPKTPKNSATDGRLSKSLDPEDNRKIVFGHTAAASDLRYWEIWASDYSKYDEVIAAAAHTINAYKELYFEDDLAFDAAGNVQSAYSGVVTRSNSTASSVVHLAAGAGTLWSSTSTFASVAYYVLRWINDTKKLPNGVPSRYTQVVEGALVYDPRQDSAFGGSGTHDVSHQRTWSYSTLDSNGQPIGRNNALQVLWYLLGWHVTNTTTGESVLVAGRGVDPTDIDMASFIAAANACEAAGYYTDCILSTGDTHETNQGILTASGAIGTLLDPGGLWAYYPNVDYTGNVAITLTDDDLVSISSWNNTASIEDQCSEVAGSYVDPSTTSLYQSKPYPTVLDATYLANLGYRKRVSQDYQCVQDAALAQKLSRIILNARQYQFTCDATWKLTALAARSWDIVRWTSSRFGWSKLLRVEAQGVSAMDGVTMTLHEVDPSIWGGGTVNPEVPSSAGNYYDPTTTYLPTGVAYSLLSPTGAGTGSIVAAFDGVLLVWNNPGPNVRRTEVDYRVQGSTYWVSAFAGYSDSFSVAIEPMLPNTPYDIRIRHISKHQVPSDYVTGTITVGSNTRYVAGKLYYLDGTSIDAYKPTDPGATSTTPGNLLRSADFGFGWTLDDQTRLPYATVLTGLSTPFPGPSQNYCMEMNPYTTGKNSDHEVRHAGINIRPNQPFTFGVRLAKSPDCNFLLDVQLREYTVNGAGTQTTISGHTIEVDPSTLAAAGTFYDYTNHGTINAATMRVDFVVRSPASGGTGYWIVDSPYVTLVAAAATDTTIAPSAGSVSDTRSVNSPPSYYRALITGTPGAANYGRVFTELKLRSAISAPGTDTYGVVTTKVFSFGTDNAIIQNWESNGVNYYRRSLIGDDTSWDVWTKNYSDLNKPSLATDVTGSIPDGRSLNASNTFGLRSLTAPPTITDSVVNGALQINMTSSTYYTDWGAQLYFPTVTFSGVAYSTTYYLYRTLNNNHDATGSYSYSTNLTDAVGVNKVYMGYITTRDSGSTTTATGTGAGSAAGPSGGGTNYHIS